MPLALKDTDPPLAVPTIQWVDQYIRLADGQTLNAALTVRMDEVAARLCCGERNARMLLARMQRLGWLNWTPGRGRGRVSILMLRQDPAMLRTQQLRRLLDEGQMEAAFQGLPDEAQARIKEALPAFLGATPGGTLRIPFYRPLHALDPQHVTRRTEVHMVGQLLESLTAFDRDKGCIVPALAHHWDCQQGGQQWRLWLRPGLRFQDGRPLRTQDVRATLLRLRDEPGPHQMLLEHLKQIDIRGQRLDVSLHRPDQLFLHRLATHCCAILPENDWQREDFAQLPIGAGAFRLVRNNEHRATLAAFDGYWGARPLIDEIDLWVVPPGSPLPPVDLKLGTSLATDPHGSRGSWTRLTQWEQGCEYVLLNPARTAFASAAARRAVGHWLRTHVALHALGAMHRSATGWLPGWRHAPEASKRAVTPPAVPRQVRIVTYQLDDLITLARSVQRAFELAGAQVRLDVLTAPDFVTRPWAESADVVISGEVMADDIAFGLHHCLSGVSHFHAWLGPALQRSLAATCRQLAAEPDPARRMVGWERAFAEVAAAGSVLPMRHIHQQVEHAPHLGGVSLARCGWMDFRKLWLPD